MKCVLFALALVTAMASSPESTLARDQVAVTPTMTSDGPVYPTLYTVSYTSELTTHTQMRDGSRFELWQFAGRAGDCERVVVRSDALPPAVQLLAGTPSGDPLDTTTAEPGSDAVLEQRLTASRTYYLRVSSADSARQQGHYRLRLDHC
jgi:hypothetical protein